MRPLISDLEGDDVFVGLGGRRGGTGGRCAWTSHPEDRFRFRPPWPCDEFVAAVAAEDAGFWHPVKERECWLGYLDSCNTTACII